MNPRLIAISGPLRGSTFPLSSETQSIGRDSTNWIAIAGRSVSRMHCSVVRTGTEFKIVDLDSKNGTCVNSIPIRERGLQEGDRIEVGESVFLFVTTDEQSAAPPVEQDQSMSAIPTVRLRLEDVLYLEPEKLLLSVPLTTRIVRGLDALLKLSRSIQGVHDFAMLRERILRSLFDTTPAERASLILIQGESKEVDSIWTCDRNLQQLESSISSSVIQQLIQEETALLSNDIIRNESVPGSEKPMVTSLIAAPMQWMGRLRGILYLDTGNSDARFDEDHLQLAMAIASLGAVALEGLRHLETLRGDHNRLIEQLRITHSMVGESPAMKEVYGLIAKVAPVDSTVLIHGESGTGKELVAHALHLNGTRGGKPFVAINCANLSESLLESELFGYEKGAFTGANALKKGKLETADGGTLFLDEIGELAPGLQARLLRVLQEREFERVGGTRPVRVDIRLIAATNKDLPQAVKDGRFRDDLYYRLNVVQIHLPPLRNRKEDIPLLASYFAGLSAQKCGRRIEGISEEARRCLMEYSWPGNVRELQNCIERAVVLGTEDTILPEDLPESVLENGAIDPPVARYQGMLREAKRKMVQDALQKTGGNHNEAAALLGMHPNNLRRLLRTLGVK